MLGFILLVLYVGKFQIPRYIFTLIPIVPLLCGTHVLLHIPSCPNCFGMDLCEHLTNGAIQLHWLSKCLLILNPKLTKSVFFGTFNSSRNVVLKSMTRRGQYTVKNYNLTGENFEYYLKDNIFISDEVIQDVVLCPNVRSMHILFENVEKNVTNLIITQKLWLDLQISIEPLLLKFLALMDVMPVPGYCGACGDIIIKEFKGNALNNYYNHNWVTRAFLSIQLLDMAEIFTFHHDSLIFYFTDISPDNIAVDESGRIYLTDLDHVIISERRLNHNDNAREKGLVHVSATLDPVKLTVIPSDVCKYPISDHNYFTVCKNILIYSEEMKKGLLSSVPGSVNQRENLKELLEECGLPRKYDNRLIAGRLLRKALSGAITDFTWVESS